MIHCIQLHWEPYFLKAYSQTQSVGPGALFASTWANGSHIQYNIAWYYSWKLNDRVTERETSSRTFKGQTVKAWFAKNKKSSDARPACSDARPACSTAAFIFSCTFFFSRISFKCRKYDVVCDPFRIECVSI